MSKGKKGKVSVDAGGNWDEGLVNEVVNDNDWQSNLVFLAPNSSHDEAHIKTLGLSADGGNRKKFYVLDKQQLIQMALDDAKAAASVPSGGGGGKKSKQGSAAQMDKLPHVQVCHQVSNCLSSNEELSPSLLARLLKYAILKKRKSDISDREPPVKEPVEPTKPDKSATKKGSGSGRASKAGKKGKDTPSQEAPPSVSIPQKPPTDMKKRGEENLDSQYINDEPADGPSCYVLLTGFSSAELFKELTSLKLSITAFVKVLDGDSLSKSGNVETTAVDQTGESMEENGGSYNPEFCSKLLKVIDSSPTDSMLRNMALLELIVTQSNVSQNEQEMLNYGQQLFDNLAMRLYLLLEQYKQYQLYLKFLDVQPMPPRSGQVDEATQMEPNSPRAQGSSLSYDDAHYHSILRNIPEECCTLPLMMHSMLEQVSVSLDNKPSERMLPLVDKTEKNTVSISDEIDCLLSSLKLKEDKERTDSNIQAPVRDDSKQPPVLYSALDEVAHKFRSNLSSSRYTKVTTLHEDTNLVSALSQCLTMPKDSVLDRDALIHVINHFSLSGKLTLPAIRFALLVMSLEHLHLPNASTCLNHNPETPKLLFDHPFTFEDEKCSSDSDTAPVVAQHSLSKNLPSSKRNLESFSVQQLMSRAELLQTLQSLQATHPYLCVCHSHHCKCNVLVAHTGFDGEYLYNSNLSFQVASKVGFQNYLEYLADAYGPDVDRLSSLEVEIDDTTKNDIILEELPTDGSPQSNSAVDSELKSSAVNGDAAVHDMPSGLSTQLTAYDMDGKALVGKESLDKLFTADGVQVHSERYWLAEGESPLMVTMRNEQLAISANIVWDSEKNDGYSHASPECDTNDNEHSLPSKLTSASLFASFNNHLNVSVSCYGSKGNGKLPYLPVKPKILDEPSRPASSRAQSQQSASPQKLSKKQQEQQQQLLEQQRLIEEQRSKDKKAASEVYQKEYQAILKNNIGQQFFATTESGLHLHCQILQDYDPDSTTSTAVTVRQSCIDEDKPNFSQALREEKQRCYLPDGNVVRYMVDGSVIILCTDGTTYQTASKSQHDLYDKLTNGTNEDFPVETVAESSSAVTVKSTQGKSEGKLWLITEPFGHQYLWKTEATKVVDISEGSSCSIASQNKEETQTEDVPVPPTSTSFVYVKSLHASKSTDPVSKEVYVSREDGVTLLYRPDGSFVAQYVDGTRCTVTAKAPSLVCIECPGFAAVTCSVSEGRSTIKLPEGIVIECSSDGSYSVDKPGDYHLDISAQGKAEYKTNGSRYTLIHSGQDNVLDACDKAGSTYQVNIQGRGSADGKNVRESDLQQVFQPRFFIVDSAGACAELLDSKAVDSTIKNALQVPRAVLLEDHIQGVGKSSTLLKPREECSKPQYTKQDIVPSGIRNQHLKGQFDSNSSSNPTPRFGTSVGKGLCIGSSAVVGQEDTVAEPKAITYSQYIHMDPITTEMKQDILSSLQSSNKWLDSKLSNSSSGDGVRDQGSVSQFSNKLETDQDKLRSLYKRSLQCPQETDAVVSKLSSAQSKVPVSSVQNEGDETDALRAALRGKIVPPYTYSAHKLSNTAQSPNMELLTSQLAKQPNTGTNQSSVLDPTSSPTPLQPGSLGTNAGKETQPAKVSSDWPTGMTETTDSVTLQGESGKPTLNSYIPTMQKACTIGEPVSRKIRTSSLRGLDVYPLQQIEVSPAEVDFGVLEEGCTYQITITLKNVGVTPSRFKIKQPPPSTGIKVIYSPGQIAAGMSRSVTVELFAMAVGAVGQYGRGAIHHILEVNSEGNVIHLPIKADVLTSAASAMLETASVGERVRMTANRPPSRESVKTLARGSH